MKTLSVSDVEVASKPLPPVDREAALAGMFGVSQDSTGALTPEFGWAIVYENAS